MRDLELRAESPLSRRSSAGVKKDSVELLALEMRRNMALLSSAGEVRVQSEGRN